MDHSVEPAESVDLLCNVAHFPDTGQIADNRGFRARNSRERCIGLRQVAAVHDDLMSHLDQQLCGHQTQTGRGAGDEDTRHFIFSDSRQRVSLGCGQEA